MNTKEIITGYMGTELAGRLSSIPADFFEEVKEIRLRVDRPLMIYGRNREYFLKPDGQLTSRMEKGYKPSREIVLQCMELMSQYSMYAFEEELRMGYITLPGGHRVGVAGKTVVEGGRIRTIKNISGLNIRIAHQIKGCGESVLPYVAMPEVFHTLIISPPACGKTTLLRDMVRMISDGVSGRLPGRTVGVVDERSEIAGCYMGLAQNDMGARTDVLDGCPKAEGMILLLRSMSPAVIAVDEIGSAADIRAVEDIVNAGIKLLCTVHGRDLEDVRQKPLLGALLCNKVFQRYVVLSAPGKVSGIWNGEGARVDL